MFEIRVIHLYAAKVVIMSDAIRLGFSVGDINGIGLEVLLKTFSDNRMFKSCIPILYASNKVVAYHKKALNIEQANFQSIQQAQDAKAKQINVITSWDGDVQITLGQPDAAVGKFAVHSLNAAMHDLKEGHIDGLVTLPINKDVISGDDFPYKGHTEFVRDRLGAAESLMFLVSEQLRVGLVTNHLSVAEIAASITEEAILKKTRIMAKSLTLDFGIEKPKIAVLGLNPHAGDNGLIGEEDKTIISGAIQKLKEEGIMAIGPYPSDGFFGMRQYKKFDGVLAMYHDQGLIPFKMISFEDGVNYTAGLPAVRTSPDHGTAYDIAGQGIASEASLRNAIFLAIDVVRRRQVHTSPPPSVESTAE
ncbi:MAG: 4-hydroxythreonine-4-phosphate dehydrogenase PdxA [Saprospiraceae bacterium]|nr:4-hydroxythreonine-4-phosphate dehydrogenase PdxA [Saprospiraceae bacterium]